MKKIIDQAKLDEINAKIDGLEPETDKLKLWIEIILAKTEIQENLVDKISRELSNNNDYGKLLDYLVATAGHKKLLEVQILLNQELSDKLEESNQLYDSLWEESNCNEE